MQEKYPMSEIEKGKSGMKESVPNFLVSDDWDPNP